MLRMKHRRPLSMTAIALRGRCLARCTSACGHKRVGPPMPAWFVAVRRWRCGGVDGYSPLADLSKENVGRLKVVWEWDRTKSGSPTGRFPTTFRAHGMMIDNVVYISTMYTRVVALDAETGAQIWAVRPGSLPMGTERPGDRLHPSRPHPLVGRGQTVHIPRQSASPHQAGCEDRAAGSAVW